MHHRSRFTSRTLAIVLGLLVGPQLAAKEPPAAATAAPPATAPAASPLPSAEEISKRHLAAVGGEEAVKKNTRTTIKGTFSMPAMGLSGPMASYRSDPNLYLAVITFPGAGEVRTGFDGTVAWSQDQMQGPRLMEGGELAQIKREAKLGRDLDILGGWDAVKVTARTDFGGVPCIEVEVTGDGDTSKFYFDDATGLYRGSRVSTQSPLGKVQVETVVSDYREFDGVKFPMKTELSMMNQKQVIAVESVSFDAIDPKVFELPAAVKALAEGKKDAPAAPAADPAADPAAKP